MTFFLSCLPTDIDVDVEHGAKVGQRKRRRRRRRSPRAREFDRRRVVRHDLDALEELRMCVGRNRNVVFRTENGWRRGRQGFRAHRS